MGQKSQQVRGFFFENWQFVDKGTTWWVILPVWVALQV